MIKNGKLTIHRISQSQWLMLGLFILPFICPGLIELFKLPSLVRYSMDICWCLLLVLLALNRGRLNKIPVLLGWITAFFGYAVISYLFHFQSPLYLLWGIRNNFRFYVCFLAVVCFLESWEKDQYMKALDILFWINAFVSVIQYFVFDYTGDHLGGLFGVLNGANGYTNLFLMIYLSKTMLWYLQGEESTASSMIKVAVCVFIAALAEMKFFFIEAVIVIILMVVITRNSMKKVLMFCAALAALPVGIEILSVVFPSSRDFFRLENLIEKIFFQTTYSTADDLGRFTAIFQISDTIMESAWQRLFGFGLGNCDYAAYSFLQTPFYLQYEYLHYFWLSTAFVFLEMGGIGLVFFFGFFGVVFWKSGRLRKRDRENEKYCQLAMLTAVICVMTGIYNSSLRYESAYLVYFIMALPFVRQGGRTG